MPAMQLAGKIAGRNLAIAVHQHDKPLLMVILQNNRLDHLMRIKPQLARRLRRTAMRLVSIQMGGEINTLRAQKTHSRRHGIMNLGHKTHS